MVMGVLVAVRDRRLIVMMMVVVMIVIVMIVIVIVMTMAGMVVAVMVPGRDTRIRLAVLLDDEAPADQDAVIVADQAAGDVRRQPASADIPLHRGFEIGEQVQHRGDEHVAGEAADQVEMQFHARMSPDRSFRGGARANCDISESQFFSNFLF